MVDEGIRDKTVRIKYQMSCSQIYYRYKYRPIDNGEVIYSSSELEDDTYIALYKRNISQNLRRDVW